MAKRYPGAPKLLLYMVSAIITTITLVYGTNVGWFSIPMMYLYGFFIVYYFTICKGDRAACCYTIAGAVTSAMFLLSVKFIDSVLGVIIGFIIAFIVAFMTDIIVKSDWRYFSLGDFDFSSFPLERSIQFKYDQHVPVDDQSPSPDPETPSKESDVKSQAPKKKIEKPLSRKEKKAEAKKQKKEKAK